MASKIDKAHNEELKSEWERKANEEIAKIAKANEELSYYGSLKSLMSMIETAKYELPEFYIPYHKDEVLEDGKTIMVFPDYSLIECWLTSRSVDVVKHAISLYKMRLDVKTYPSWGKEAMRSAKIYDNYNNKNRY